MPDFARKQNQSADGFIASMQSAADAAAASTEAALKGMAEMSALYEEKGREQYLGAGGGSGIDLICTEKNYLS